MLRLAKLIHDMMVYESHVYEGAYETCTYWSTSRTQKESMNGKLPAMASNSACEMKPSLSWS